MNPRSEPGRRIPASRASRRTADQRRIARIKRLAKQAKQAAVPYWPLAGE